MDPFESFVRNFYLPNKMAYSRQLDTNLSASKAPLPVLGKAGSDGRVWVDTVNAVNAECGKLRYTSDPLGGLIDYYNHPEVTQWRQNNKRWDVPCDCDDFAVYAVALFRKCGVSTDKAWVWNLLIDPGLQISQAWANHVICGVEIWDGSKFWTAVIDTNSAALNQVFWFAGDRTAAASAVMAHFSGIYKVTYYRLVQVEYPF